MDYGVKISKYLSITVRTYVMQNIAAHKVRCLTRFYNSLGA